MRELCGWNVVAQNTGRGGIRMERYRQRNCQGYAAKQVPTDTSKMFYCVTFMSYFSIYSQNKLTAIPSPQA